MPEEVETICPDCGKSKGKKGSITQWLGMGEQCQCNLPKVSSQAITGRKRTTACRRCRKPKPTAKQSMTQWLFKREFCQCAESPKEPQEPIRIPLSPRNLAALSPTPTRANKLLVGGIIGTVFGVAILCSAMMLQLPGMFDWKISLAQTKGKDRQIVCYQNPDFAERTLIFDDKAIAAIVKDPYAYLSISDSQIDDRELRSLGSISSLYGLSLQNCSGFSPAGLVGLVNNDHLKYLSLAHTPVSQKCLEALAESNLETLNLSDTYIGTANWASLTEISSLKKLVVHGEYVSSQNRASLEHAHFQEKNGDFLRSVEEAPNTVIQ